MYSSDKDAGQHRQCRGEVCGMFESECLGSTIGDYHSCCCGIAAIPISSYAASDRYSMISSIWRGYDRSNGSWSAWVERRSDGNTIAVADTDLACLTAACVSIAI